MQATQQCCWNSAVFVDSHFKQKAQSVKDALEILVGRDQLEGVTCSRTNQEIEAWQQVTLEELPLVLLLHLKWFDYKLDGASKIVKCVEFPIDLKVDPSKYIYLWHGARPLLLCHRLKQYDPKQGRLNNMVSMKKAVFWVSTSLGDCLGWFLVHSLAPKEACFGHISLSTAPVFTDWAPAHNHEQYLTLLSLTLKVEAIWTLELQYRTLPQCARAQEHNECNDCMLSYWSSSGISLELLVELDSSFYTQQDVLLWMKCDEIIMFS